MHQILKIRGVSADQLGTLHKAVAEARTNHEIFYRPEGYTEAQHLHLQAEIVKSKFNAKNGLYTVTIEMPMLVEGDSVERKPSVLYPSIRLLRQIYDALGVFPDEEKLIEVGS